MARAAYAGFFGVPPEHVLIRTPFIGGGFGSKAILAGAHILCALAARMTGRPVKLALTRAQMFGPVGHRGQTRQRLRLGHGDQRPAHRDLSSRDRGDEQLRRIHRTCRRRLAHALCQSGHRHCPRGRAQRHRHAGAHARAGPRPRIGGARGCYRRSGGSLRHGPARFPARELCGGRADNRQTLFVEGAARMLRASRDEIRLVGAAARAPADARRQRLPRRLGHGNRGVPLPDVRCGGAGSAPRRWRGHDRDKRDRHGAGRLDGVRADRRGQPRARRRPGHVALRRHPPARRRGRRRIGPHGDRRLGHRRGRPERRRAARRARHG